MLWVPEREAVIVHIVNTTRPRRQPVHCGARGAGEQWGLRRTLLPQRPGTEEQ